MSLKPLNLSLLTRLIVLAIAVQSPLSLAQRQRSSDDIETGDSESFEAEAPDSSSGESTESEEPATSAKSNKNSTARRKKSVLGALKPLKEEAPKLPPAQINVKWIGPRGDLQKLDWPIQHRWVWAPLNPKFKVPIPVLRTWVQLPDLYAIKSVTGTALKFHQNPKNSPFSGKNEVVALDTNLVTTQASLQLENPQGKLEEFGLILELAPGEPIAWTHQSCLDLNLSLEKRKGTARFLYTSITCKDRGEAMELFLMHSPESNLVHTTIPKKIRETPDYTRFRIKKPTGKAKKILALFEIANQNNQDTNQYSLEIKEETNKPRSFSFNFGLSVSSLNYKEEFNNLKLTELGLTGKVGANWAVARWLSLSGNFFMTLWPISHSPSTIEAARFYGVNGRVGFRLPFQTGSLEYFFSIGWYFWGMLVPSKNYGLQQLAGPQAFLTISKPPTRSRAFYIYFKIAPISDSTSSLGLANREIAGGFGYQLNTPRPGSHSLMLTVDLANTSFDLATLNNKIELTSISGGLQFNW